MNSRNPTLVFYSKESPYQPDNAMVKLSLDYESSSFLRSLFYLKVHAFQKHTKVVDQGGIRVGIFKIMG